MRWKTICGVLVVVIAAALLSFRTCDPSKARYAYGWERCFYPTLRGKVVDAETGAPIEGAVVFCMWTIQRGAPGLSHSGLDKVVEVISAKDGSFSMPGTWNPSVNRPDLSIYKRGYVLWNNKNVFPSRARRQDFRWESGLAAKLERWRQGYSYIEHEDFIASHSFHDYDRSATTLYKATHEELPFVLQEQDALNTARSIKRREP